MSHIKARLKRYKQLLRLAQMKQNLALKELGRANQSYEQAKNRYRDLIQYHTEYQNDLNTRGKNSLNVSLLHNQANFIEQLEHLMVEQKKICKKKYNDMEVAREKWTSAHAELKAMNTMYDKVKNEAVKYFDKKDQEFIEDLLNSRREHN